jgi:hypothetical protein
MSDHLFKPGDRVAVQTGGRFSSVHQWREDFVLKVYKNGNFVLKSAPTQQWRPWTAAHETIPHARMTGDGNYHGNLKLWTPEADAEIKADIAETQRRQRWSNIESSLYRLPYASVSDESLELFERAINALRPKDKSNGG